jgi:hypothetical protein
MVLPPRPPFFSHLSARRSDWLNSITDTIDVMVERAFPISFFSFVSPFDRLPLFLRVVQLFFLQRWADPGGFDATYFSPTGEPYHPSPPSLAVVHVHVRPTNHPVSLPSQSLSLLLILSSVPQCIHLVSPFCV